MNGMPVRRDEFLVEFSFKLRVQCIDEMQGSDTLKALLPIVHGNRHQWNVVDKWVGMEIREARDYIEL